MRRPYEQMRRWLEQAEHQLEVTESLLEAGFWSDVCFMAEQTSQMALKAFLYGKGTRHILLHSVQELASECGKLDYAFAEVVEWGKILDRYYIPTRYPDALASPAVPFRSFTQDDARQARRYAADIVELVKTHSAQLRLSRESGSPKPEAWIPAQGRNDGMQTVATLDQVQGRNV